MNTRQFQNLFGARSRAATWRKHPNEDRPHWTLDYRTPSEFAEHALTFETKRLNDLAAT